ncbi:hypothetical protein TorRG33x02_227690 [Trema orientale]|uniref:Secreted protein n=1 Tax=Trema orientale TaxID=63057 RepID=A0A2P5E790_TREOI|nr:hypothetical protein TorRG33x02_227690 [Trema orientale]
MLTWQQMTSIHIRVGFVLTCHLSTSQLWLGNRTFPYTPAGVLHHSKSYSITSNEKLARNKVKKSSIERIQRAMTPTEACGGGSHGNTAVELRGRFLTRPWRLKQKSP